MGSFVVRAAAYRTIVCVVSALLMPAAVHAQTTALFFDSQPGDWIGAGERKTYTPAEATFTIRRNFDNGISVDVDSPTFGTFWWSLDFSASDLPLQVGTYHGARRAPFT